LGLQWVAARESASFPAQGAVPGSLWAPEEESEWVLVLAWGRRCTQPPQQRSRRV